MIFPCCRCWKYNFLSRTHQAPIWEGNLMFLKSVVSKCCIVMRTRFRNVSRGSHLNFLFGSTAKHKLIALPNNARVAARTNAMLAGVLEGQCGCRAMTRHCKSSNPDKVSDEFTELWQQAFVQFLQAASNGTSCWFVLILGQMIGNEYCATTGIGLLVFRSSLLLSDITVEWSLNCTVFWFHTPTELLQEWLMQKHTYSSFHFNNLKEATHGIQGKASVWAAAAAAAGAGYVVAQPWISILVYFGFIHQVWGLRVQFY